MLQSFKHLFTVSCLDLTLLIIFFFFSGTVIQLGHFTFKGASPAYPSSASTRSSRSSHNERDEQKISTSGNAPAGKGPLIHTKWPEMISTPSSYLSADFPPYLCDAHGLRKTPGLGAWFLVGFAGRGINLIHGHHFLERFVHAIG